MSKQLESLMKRAGEAGAQKRQKELDRKFFAWLEDTFNIEEYDKTNLYGRPAAVIDNSLAFVCTGLREMTAYIYLRCNLCGNDVHDCGEVRNLGELGDRLLINGEGNFPNVCKNIFMKEPKWLVNHLFPETV